ncbi:MAG: thioredoxin, partial [Firmicutes bacterium]|nr:thioredoxin [Bacillota bacterium]
MEKNLTQDTFDGEVLKSSIPVLVDFWASWCGPCRTVSPIISQIAEEYDGKISVGKVNVDENAALAASFAVVSIPTVILFVNGDAVERIVGARSFDDYADVIEQYI